MSARGRLSADEAARRLGVRRDTLYAYVSRGLIRSEEQRGTRARLYHAEDVERLIARRQAQGPGDANRFAKDALSFGAPLLDSRLTLIRDDRLYYRGLPAEGFLGEASFEQVAGFLWGGSLADGIDPVVPALPRSLPDPGALAALPPLERFQVVLAAKAGEDASGHDRSPAGVRRIGAKVLRLLCASATGGATAGDPIARTLAHAWAPGRGDAAHALLESALILWADHELNVSTFTVRCVASAQATPYAAVIAGLSALGGALHGGATGRVEALFDEIGTPARAQPVLEARLRRGEIVPGFGHPLYREGDPRARALLDALRSADVGEDAVALAEAIATACERLIARAPNVDFATVAMCRALALPPGAALSLVAIARSAGWIAHALEQQQDGRLIRPRARYVGDAP